MEKISVGRQNDGAWVGIETEETLAKSASRYDTEETYSPIVDTSIFCFDKWLFNKLSVIDYEATRRGMVPIFRSVKTP